MHIPVEVSSDDDARQLEAVQKDLIAFGLDSPPTLLAKHIYESDLFSRTLPTPLYPILKPAGSYGIYQTRA